MSRYNSSKTGSFSAAVDKWIAETEDRMIAVVRYATSDVIDEAQTAREKGGKMPVDTGFLRKSGTSHLNSMPTGPTRGESKVPNSYPSEETYSDNAQVKVDLANLTMNDVFYFGWTAEYARKQNLDNGFADAAIQNWQQYVNTRASELMKRSGK